MKLVTELGRGRSNHFERGFKPETKKRGPNICPHFKSLVVKREGSNPRTPDPTQGSAIDQDLPYQAFITIQFITFTQ